jgi:Holliday junction resolvasome RuvABC endonuclease subunit
MVVLAGKAVHAKKIEVPASRTKDRAYVQTTLYREASSYLDEVGPTHVFIEEPVVAGARNLRSSLLIAQTCGSMLCVAGMERVVRLVPVSSWKKATVGIGSADKDAVRRYIDTFHPQVAKVCGFDQDLYDAACVALYGQGLLRRVSQLSDGFQDDP